MEKLSIEEKAKAYDEAIERAKAIYQGSYKLDTAATIAETLQNVFPELKESEDERIRKVLINIVKGACNKYGIKYQGKEITEEKLLNWLEKQGENVYNEELSKLLHKVICSFINNPDIPYSKRDEVSKKIIPYVEKLEKQGEQNLANYAKTCKVEPKFHKGEWLCENEPNNYARFIQILETVNVQGKNRYSISRDIHNDEDIVDFDFVEKYYHKFGIQDAKDGDVLYYKDEISLYKHDIKNCTKQETTFGGFVYHCCYDGEGFITDSLYSLTEQDKMDIHPATKEQRDLLFQKMKEAGYEWDAEKKVLKKNEQNSADNIIEEEKPLLEKFKQAVYDCAWGKVTCKKEGETKEEYANRWAEHFLLMVRDWADDYIDYAIQQKLRKSYDKGKKDAIKTNSPAWSEEDERIYKVILEILNSWSKGTIGGEVIPPNTGRYINWFKSFKDRVQPQPKQEWSEDDEQYLLVCKNALAKYQTTDKWDAGIILHWLEDRLESLKPQTTWKPSDEQMEALGKICEWISLPTAEILDEIRSLYNELKKLKG